MDLAPGKHSRHKHANPPGNERQLAYRSAPSACNASSMEVNERVITVLFSSAGERRITCEQTSSIGVPLPQVIANVLIFSSRSAYRAASTASEVRPEREIKTGWQGTGKSLGKSRISDAGIARAGVPVKIDQLAAAICSR